MLGPQSYHFGCLAFSQSTTTISTHSPLSSLMILLFPLTSHSTEKTEVISQEPLQISIPVRLAYSPTHLFPFPRDTTNNICFRFRLHFSTYVPNVILLFFLGNLVLFVSRSFLHLLPLSFLSLSADHFSSHLNVFKSAFKKERYSLDLLCPSVYDSVSSTVQNPFKKLCAFALFFSFTHSFLSLTLQITVIGIVTLSSPWTAP